MEQPRKGLEITFWSSAKRKETLKWGSERWFGIEKTRSYIHLRWLSFILCGFADLLPALDWNWDDDHTCRWQESAELEEGGPGKRHAKNPGRLEGGQRRCSSAPGLYRGCVGLTPGILRPTGLLRKLSMPRPTLQSLWGVPTSQTSFIALWARIFVKSCRIIVAIVFLLWCHVLWTLAFGFFSLSQK